MGIDEGFDVEYAAILLLGVPKVFCGKGLTDEAFDFKSDEGFDIKSFGPGRLFCSSSLKNRGWGSNRFRVMREGNNTRTCQYPF